MSESLTPARLLCRTGALTGQSHDLDGDTLIGSASENEVVLDTPGISGRHARIYSEDRTYWLEDLGSTNGTWLDGVRVGKTVPLDRLHVITFSRGIDFVFVLMDHARSSDGENRAGTEAGPAEPEREPTVPEPEPMPPEPGLSPPEPPTPTDQGPGQPGTIIGDAVLGALPDLDESPRPESSGAEASDSPEPGMEATSDDPASSSDPETIVDGPVLGALPELGDARPSETPPPEATDSTQPVASEPADPPAPEDCRAGPGTIVGGVLGELPNLTESTPVEADASRSSTREAETSAREAEAEGSYSRETEPIEFSPEAAEATESSPRESEGKQPPLLDAVTSVYESFGGLAAHDVAPRVDTEPASLRLSVTLADGTVADFQLAEGENTLGRSTDCDVVIKGDMFISRGHAVVDVNEGQVVVRDLGGGNGTWIGDTQVHEAALTPGDTFRLGPNLEFTLELR